MGDNTLNTQQDATVIYAADVNDLKDAMTVNLVPRNSSGVATNEAGSIGTSVLSWANGWFQNIYAKTKVVFGTSDLNDPQIAKVSTDMSIDAKIQNILMKASSSLTVTIGGITKMAVNSTGIDGQYLKLQSVAINKQALPAIEQSLSSGSFSTTSSSFVDVTNLSVDITALGARPIAISIVSGGDTTESYIGFISTAGSIGYGVVELLRDGTTIGTQRVGGYTSDPTYGVVTYCPSSIIFYDTPSSGTHTYSVRTKRVTSGTVYVTNAKLLAVEL